MTTKYEEVLAVINTSKRAMTNGKKIGNNTYAIPLADDGAIAIQLHGTYVVTLYPNGEVELNSGGWETVTTKDRINKYSPFYVYSEKGEWRVDIKTRGKRNPKFRDGIRLNHKGEVLNG